MQVNLNSDPNAVGVIQIMPVADPQFPGVAQANINADPLFPGVIQANINFDPTTPGLVFVNFNITSETAGPPENITIPVIYGIGQVGETLTVVPGTWSGSPVLTYAWRRDGGLIGVNTPTYVPVLADAPHVLTVDETATEDGHPTTVSSRAQALGMFTSRLDGAGATLLYALPSQEANHGHRSPDGAYISFTVYDRVSPPPTPSDPAVEGASYLNTGIRTLRISDGLVETRVANDPLYNNSNPAWWPDGLSFVYTTTQGTTGGHDGVGRYVLSTGIASIFYDPIDINVADFDVGADEAIIMGGQGPGGINVLYTLIGGVRAQLTNPVSGGSFNPRGDFDPHWSHDQTKVACVRAVEPGLFKIVVVTLGPGHTFASEIVIAPNGSATAFDGVPEWSSDDTKIITWHTDPDNRAESGIYSMNPDGTGRTMVALPAGFTYNTVAFSPGGGSSAAAPIIFSGRPLPIFPAIPVNTVLPVISGIAGPGEVLHTTNGAWDNTTTGFHYQWQSDGVNATGSGATTADYTIAVADIGTTITSIVKARNSGGLSAGATSVGVGPVSSDPFMQIVLDMDQAFPFAA